MHLSCDVARISLIRLSFDWRNPDSSQMITDIPTSKDFQESGIGFLNLAWDNAITLLQDLDEWNISDFDDDGEIQKDYWASAQRLLATALALTQQGIEMLLKARVAEASVFLLVSGEPRYWPHGCNIHDVPFADFRTIDAQDLIRVHDTVCTMRLSDDFKATFEKMRRLRNSVFHTVDRRVKVKVDDILRSILFASEILIGPQKWVSLRREFISASPNSVPNGGDFADALLIRELHQATQRLTNAETERFIGLKQKQRRYLCCLCERNCGEIGLEGRAKFAQLVPNEPTSTVLHCYACGFDTLVVRMQCVREKCKSNVLESEYGVCCVCFKPQDDWPPS